MQQETDLAMINEFCAISRTKVYGQFFFAETTVSEITHLDMLEQWSSIHLNTSSPFQTSPLQPLNIFKQPRPAPLGLFVCLQAAYSNNNGFNTPMRMILLLSVNCAQE